MLYRQGKFKFQVLVGLLRGGRQSTLQGAMGQQSSEVQAVQSPLMVPWSAEGMKSLFTIQCSSYKEPP